MITKFYKPILIKSKEKTSSIGQYADTGKLVYNDHKSDIDRGIPMELVLVSLDLNEKIEVGCYAIDNDNYLIKVNTIIGNELSFIPLYNDVYCNTETFHPIDRYKRVIAIQSQITEECIQQYIKEYNKNNIKDIEIEMIDNGYEVDMEGVGGEDIGWVPKLEPRFTNGFITIINLESDSDWWIGNHPKSRYEMIQQIYPGYTGPITIEMIKYLRSKFNN